MEACYLDTHVILWLYQSAQKKLSPTATACIEQALTIKLSPMVSLEMGYLHEIGRVTEKPDIILRYLSARLPISVCHQPFQAVVDTAQILDWTRDPFDRIIVAQSALTNSPLITIDEKILANYEHATW